MNLKFTLLIILLVNFLTAKSQSNEYFSHNENWVVETVVFSNSYGYQISIIGDTISNNDTLYKLHDSVNDLYYLAKSNDGILYLANVNEMFSDTTQISVFDYSRIDSITMNHTDLSWPNNSGYLAYKILAIDTFNLGGQQRKVFTIDENFPGFYGNAVYEGVFHDNLNFTFGLFFEWNTFLRCYSINGFRYVAYHDFNNNEFFEIDSACVYVNSSGLNELESSYIQIFPNPTTDKISIEETDMSDFNYQILNMQGKVLMENVIENSNLEIDVSQLNSGIYLVQFQKNGRRYSSKFVKT